MFRSVIDFTTWMINAFLFFTGAWFWFWKIDVIVARWQERKSKDQETDSG